MYVKIGSLNQKEPPFANSWLCPKKVDFWTMYCWPAVKNQLR